jgi:hypothetical protein
MASPSMIKDCERSLATASTIRGSQVIARSAVEPHPFAGLASNNPEPVVLDFMQPDGGRRAAAGLMWGGTAQ